MWWDRAYGPIYIAVFPAFGGSPITYPVCSHSDASAWSHHITTIQLQAKKHIFPMAQSIQWLHLLQVFHSHLHTQSFKKGRQSHVADQILLSWRHSFSWRWINATLLNNPRENIKTNESITFLHVVETTKHCDYKRCRSVLYTKTKIGPYQHHKGGEKGKWIENKTC